MRAAVAVRAAVRAAVVRAEARVVEAREVVRVEVVRAAAGWATGSACYLRGSTRGRCTGCM